MAAQACRAVILIIIHTFMFIIHIRLIMFMAADAGEDGKVASVLMALRTLCPLVAVLAAIYREILRIVVKRGRLPGCLRMACFTLMRETGAGMIRILRAGEITLMTAVAGVRCLSIISVVTVRAVISDLRMPAQKLKIIVMIRELRG